MTASRPHSVGARVLAEAAGVIFDLNGVLIEDEALHEQAFSRVLARYDVALTHAMYRATILGRTDRDGVARLAAAYAPSLPIEMVVREKQRRYREALRAEGAQYVADGAQSLIAALEARGLRLALASASPAAEVYAWLDYLGLTGAACAFDPIFTSESAPGPKPDPAVFEAIRARWDIPAAACVVIDDHPANIAIAHALGMRTIAVASTLSPSAFPHACLVVSAVGKLAG